MVLYKFRSDARTPRAEVDRTVLIPASSSSSEVSSSAPVEVVVLLLFFERLGAAAAVFDLPEVFFCVAVEAVFLFAALAPFTLEAGPALLFFSVALAGEALRVVRRPEVVVAAEADPLSFAALFRVGTRREA